MSGSGLQAGKIIPVRVTEPKGEEYHRRLLAEAINHVAACAYQPGTWLESRVDSIALTGSYQSMEIDITVTPYIPVRAHIIIFFYVRSNGVDDLEPSIRVTENGNTISQWDLSVLPTGIPDYIYPLQLLRDLLPNVTYVFSLLARKPSGKDGPLQDGDCLAPTSMSVRLESRILPPEGRLQE